jgi:hypothetical protein
MRKKSKKVLCFIFCTFISFFVLLYAVTEYRENSYDFLVQSFQLPEETRRQGMDEAREYQRESLKVFTVDPPLDEIFNDPVMVEYVAETHANALKYEHDYHFDMVPETCEREQSIFPLQFFYLYGKLYSFENLHLVGVLSFIHAYDLGPFSNGASVFNDMGTAIYAWESGGNAREGEWMDTFMTSPEYEAFLQDLYAKIEPLEGKSLESVVKEIHEVPTESQNPLSNMKTPFLKDAQELATAVYETYQKDKQQGDISRVTFEAKILHKLHERALYIEKLTPYQCRSLRWPESSLPDPFVDLAGILVSSAIISFIVTYFLSKKYWK